MRERSSHGYAVFSLQSRESRGITWQILIYPSSGGFQHLVPEEGLPSHAGGEGDSVRASSLRHERLGISAARKRSVYEIPDSILVSDQPRGLRRTSSARAGCFGGAARNPPVQPESIHSRSHPPPATPLQTTPPALLPKCSLFSNTSDFWKGLQAFGGGGLLGMLKSLLQQLPLPLPYSLFLSRDRSFFSGKSFSGYKISSEPDPRCQERSQHSRRSFPSPLCG